MLVIERSASFTCSDYAGRSDHLIGFYRPTMAEQERLLPSRLARFGPGPESCLMLLRQLGPLLHCKDWASYPVLIAFRQDFGHERHSICR